MSILEKSKDLLSKFPKEKEYIKNLLENSKQITEVIKDRKDKINNINLLETSKKQLYEWKNLFSPSISMDNYIKIAKNKEKNNDEKKEKEKEKEKIIKKDEFQFPIALIDLPEEKLLNYIPNYKKIDYSNNLKNKPNIVRPTSVYTRPNKNDTFYLSKDFSDYYIEDFQTFIKKVPILQAKKRCKSAKLKKEIISSRKNEKKIEKKIENLKETTTLNIVNQYLSLAMNANNVQPLLSNIHKQIHPHEKDILTQKLKYYKNTDKPLGNDYGNVNYSFNNRYGHYLLIKKLKLKEYLENEQKFLDQIFIPLNCDTYDINDPSLKIFKDIQDSQNIIEYTKSNSQKKNINEKKGNQTINLNKKKPIVLFDKVLNSRNDQKNNNLFRLSRPLSGKNKKRIINKNNSTNNIYNNKIQRQNYPNSKKIKYLINENENIKRLNKNLFSPLSSVSIDLGDNNYTIDNTLSIINDYIPVKVLPNKINTKINNQIYKKIDFNIKKRLLNRNKSFKQYQYLKENFSQNNILIHNKFHNRPMTSKEHSKLKLNKTELSKKDIYRCRISSAKNSIQN